MSVRPYPSVARACHQLERHARPEEPVPQLRPLISVGTINLDGLARIGAVFNAAFQKRPAPVRTPAVS